MPSHTAQASPLPRFGVQTDDARAELEAGLLRAHAEIPPKYFYDPLGSKLFEAITQLPEYYPTRTEREIFEQHGADMARHIGMGTAMIDLGAGNCDKARRLFPLLCPAQYTAVDVSDDFLHESIASLRTAHPDIEMQALGMDFSEKLTLPASVRASHRLFFYPGSSIGNFTPEAALSLLREVREHCDEAGGLLIGVDLVKGRADLEAAYDDALGVTAAFNLNVLNHVNVLLGADFQPAGWRHVALFNTALSRIEMHLEAREAQTVSWPGQSRRFARGERIHTENSYKYDALRFRALLIEAGFRDVHAWTDRKHWFSVCYAKA
jgi:dimethylhistidine N-methyltransferase